MKKAWELLNDIENPTDLSTINRSHQIISELLEQNHVLLQAGKAAIARGDVSTYASEEDAFGRYACCGEVDYGEHRSTCWTLKMKKAIAMCEETK